MPFSSWHDALRGSTVDCLAALLLELHHHLWREFFRKEHEPIHAKEGEHLYLFFVTDRLRKLGEWLRTWILGLTLFDKKKRIHWVLGL